MPAVKWLSDKVGVAENGALVIIGKLFEHTGTEIEQRVGADESAIVFLGGVLLGDTSKYPPPPKT
jgi:hypothetical protein